MCGLGDPASSLTHGCVRAVLSFACLLYFVLESNGVHTRLDHISDSELETIQNEMSKYAKYLYTAIKTKGKTFQKYRNDFF